MMGITIARSIETIRRISPEMPSSGLASVRAYTYLFDSCYVPPVTSWAMACELLGGSRQGVHRSTQRRDFPSLARLLTGNLALSKRLVMPSTLPLQDCERQSAQGYCDSEEQHRGSWIGRVYTIERCPMSCGLCDSAGGWATPAPSLAPTPRPTSSCPPPVDLRTECSDWQGMGFCTDTENPGLMAFMVEQCPLSCGFVVDCPGDGIGSESDSPATTSLTTTLTTTPSTTSSTVDPPSESPISPEALAPTTLEPTTSVPTSMPATSEPTPAPSQAPATSRPTTAAPTTSNPTTSEPTSEPLPSPSPSAARGWLTSIQLPTAVSALDAVSFDITVGWDVAPEVGPIEIVPRFAFLRPLDDSGLVRASGQNVMRQSPIHLNGPSGVTTITLNFIQSRVPMPPGV